MGVLQIQRLSLYRQIELFQGTIELVKAKIGKDEADKFFQGSSYVVALGSNDFINNYLMPVYSDSWTYNDQTFITYLMDTLQAQLEVLLLDLFLNFYIFIYFNSACFSNTIFLATAIA